ncbi:MAG: YggS family pyridoxal phosphate-dependent enzyme [Halofilum sp. (in: g-proteobacteria)]
MEHATEVDSAAREAIGAALRAIETRIDRACARAERPREQVRLLPVTKTVDLARVAVVLEAGYRAVAENRVQEAAPKREALESFGAEWHMIGRLQRNKIRQALAFADCIQSVDRPALADALADRLAEGGERRQVFIQVNTSGAEGQSGVEPDAALALARRIAARPELELTGLMTIGRLAEAPEAVRGDFVRLRELRDRLEQELGQRLSELSMGMSGDLEAAVEEGATLVRIGSGIFGARPRP